MEEPAKNTELTTDDVIMRGLVTDIAIGAGPTIAVLANQAIDTIKNRPPKEQPPSIVLPPGTTPDE